MSRLFIFFQYLLPHHLLSRGVGILAQNHLLRKLFIRTFIKRYKVDLSQAKIQDVEKFENFNAFFTRELQADARPLPTAQGAIVCPADGAVSQLGDIADGNLLQAKGKHIAARACSPVTRRWPRYFSQASLPLFTSRLATIIAYTCRWLVF